VSPGLALEATRGRSSRRYERRVVALLEELERHRHRLYVLQARGVRPAGLRDLKAELRTLRNELAAVVAAAGSFSPAAAPRGQ
jgi:hypothetical protein